MQHVQNAIERFVGQVNIKTNHHVGVDGRRTQRKQRRSRNNSRRSERNYSEMTMKNIRRTKTGWMVEVEINRVRHRKSFFDSIYGGEEYSLSAAETYRNFLISTTQNRLIKVPCKEPLSGIEGIHKLSHKGEHVGWRACVRVNKKKKVMDFLFKTHDNALERAKQALQELKQKYGVS
jgi:hypothetical protein